MTTQESMNLLDKHAAQLAEHFDSVQILVTVVEDGGTDYFAKGKGDWYARRGMCHQFIDMDQAEANSNALAEKINGNED